METTVMTTTGVKVKIFEKNERILVIAFHPEMGEIRVHSCRTKGENLLGEIKVNKSWQNVELGGIAKAYSDFEDAIKKEKEEKEKASYQPLIDSLPNRRFITAENKENIAKFAELEKKLSSSHHFEDKEDEGLRIAIQSGNAEIREQMMAVCAHVLEVEYIRSYTSDFRKKVTRIISCNKCGLYIVDTAETKPKYNNYWN